MPSNGNWSVSKGLEAQTAIEAVPGGRRGDMRSADDRRFDQSKNAPLVRPWPGALVKEFPASRATGIGHEQPRDAKERTINHEQEEHHPIGFGHVRSQAHSRGECEEQAEHQHSPSPDSLETLSL